MGGYLLPKWNGIKKVATNQKIKKRKKKVEREKSCWISLLISTILQQRLLNSITPFFQQELSTLDTNQKIFLHFQISNKEKKIYHKNIYFNHQKWKEKSLDQSIKNLRQFSVNQFEKWNLQAGNPCWESFFSWTTKNNLVFILFGGGSYRHFARIPPPPPPRPSPIPSSFIASLSCSRISAQIAKKKGIEGWMGTVPPPPTQLPFFNFLFKSKDWRLFLPSSFNSQNYPSSFHRKKQCNFAEPK